MFKNSCYTPGNSRLDFWRRVLLMAVEVSDLNIAAGATERADALARRRAAAGTIALSAVSDRASFLAPFRLHWLCEFGKTLDHLPRLNRPLREARETNPQWRVAFVYITANESHSEEDEDESGQD